MTSEGCGLVVDVQLCHLMLHENTEQHSETRNEK